MNITVKAQPGGEYDVDIQKTRKEYVWWRRSTITWCFITWLFLGILWQLYTVEKLVQPGFLAALKHYSHTLFLQWQGWIFLVGSVWVVLWTEHTLNKKVHFECPFKECGVEVILSEAWECPQCRDDKITIPKYAFHTFFDKCKHGHKPTSYQCPTCVKKGRPGVFELIPGGRRDRFAKPYFAPPIQPPAQQATATNAAPQVRDEQDFFNR